ncbi:hypothetical protein AKO1_014184 [Acrasis kona]|uniref:WH2 domain-containing protein n=1 Tax=Acrasis kona TaxID=1008807 RepID=A0AAW2Z0F7_9EUKA
MGRGELLPDQVDLKIFIDEICSLITRDTQHVCVAVKSLELICRDVAISRSQLKNHLDTLEVCIIHAEQIESTDARDALSVLFYSLVSENENNSNSVKSHLHKSGIMNMILTLINRYLVDDEWMVEANVTLLYHMLVNQDAISSNMTLQSPIEICETNGLLPILMHLFCTSASTLLRMKCAFVMGSLHLDVVGKFVPHVIAMVMKQDPIDAIPIYSRAHQYPEFIWNDDMKQLLKDSLQSNLNLNQIDYKLPFCVQGVYVSVYANRGESYPVSDSFIGSLLSAQPQNLSDQRDVCASLLTCLGGAGYHNTQMVSNSASHIPELLQKCYNERDSIASWSLLQCISKCTFDANCLEQISNVANVACDLFLDAIQSQPDHTDMLLDTISRACYGNVKIADYFAMHFAEKAFDMIVNATKGYTTKNKCLQLCKYLLPKNPNLANLDANGQIASASDLDVMELKKMLLQPPVTSSTLAYMNIHIDKREENLKQKKILFEDALVTTTKERDVRRSTYVNTNSHEQVVPPPVVSLPTAVEFDAPIITSTRKHSLMLPQIPSTSVAAPPVDAAVVSTSAAPTPVIVTSTPPPPPPSLKAVVPPPPVQNNLPPPPSFSAVPPAPQNIPPPPPPPQNIPPPPPPLQNMPPPPPQNMPPPPPIASPPNVAPGRDDLLLQIRRGTVLKKTDSTSSIESEKKTSQPSLENDLFAAIGGRRGAIHNEEDDSSDDSDFDD